MEARTALLYGGHVTAITKSLSEIGLVTRSRNIFARGREEEENQSVESRHAGTNHHKRTEEKRQRRVHQGELDGAIVIDE